MILDLLALTSGGSPGFWWTRIAATVYGWPDQSPYSWASDAGWEYHCR